MILNLKGAEATLSGTGNGSTFSAATCIKLNVTANSVITLFDENDVFIGNTTLLATQTYFVEKRPTDKIRLDSGTAPATPVGFTLS